MWLRGSYCMTRVHFYIHEHLLCYSNTKHSFICIYKHISTHPGTPLKESITRKQNHRYFKKTLQKPALSTIQVFTTKFIRRIVVLKSLASSENYHTRYSWECVFKMTWPKNTTGLLNPYTCTTRESALLTYNAKKKKVDHVN